MQQVTVRVPATTSNLGPGFDCLGIALKLHNLVTVGVRRQSSTLPAIAREASEAFFARTKSRAFPFALAISGDVPVARGLGSSVTVRLGVLHALNTISNARLDLAELFALSAQLESHPDNAAPATFGGFTVARETRVQRFDVAGQLQFVLLVPDSKVRTSIARRILPQKISRASAVASAGNVAAIVAAFSSGKYENLRGCFRDGLHQPYRKKLLPFLDEVIAAAEEAGALGAFLSGSGSAICAVTLNSASTIAEAMLKASHLHRARTIITRSDNQGARVVGLEPTRKPPV